MRSAIQSIDGLAQNANGDFLIPIGGGLLLPASNLSPKKLILSVGVAVAIEKVSGLSERPFSRLGKKSMMQA